VNRPAVGSPAHRTAITVSIMAATVMQVLDTTIANVALPHMQGALSATQEQIAWVLTSYIVASAVLTPATGFLAGRLGRKRLFALAVAGFTVSSMLCGAAVSLESLVVFRLFQGAFGAALVPLSQAVLLDTYPPEKHGAAMAMWGVGVMVGPILGPTLGGLLTDAYSWRWVFYVNLPFGVLALLGILAFLPETERDTERPFDAFGFTVIAVALGALQMMLDRGELKDWFASPEIVAEAVVAAVALYVFIVHMATARRPFVEPGMFRDRNFSTGLVFIFVVGNILLATLVLLPPFLQNLMGYPVVTVGYVLAPRGMGTMAAMLLVGRLIGRVDTRALILFGLLMTALSLGEMAGFTTQVAVWDIVRTGIVQGIGLGFIFVPLSTIAFSTLAPRYRNEGTAMFSLMRNIGSGIGISVVVNLLGRYTQMNHATLGEAVNPFNPAFQGPLPPGWALHGAAGLAAVNAEVTRQAATIAYLDDFRLMMVLSLAAVPLLLLLRPPARAQAAAVPEPAPTAEAAPATAAGP
jgi:DHA2 family multidrug resistance protein